MTLGRTPTTTELVLEALDNVNLRLKAQEAMMIAVIDRLKITPGELSAALASLELGSDSHLRPDIEDLIAVLLEARG